MIKGDDMINTETNLRKIGEIQSNENQNAVLGCNTSSNTSKIGPKVKLVKNVGNLVIYRSAEHIISVPSHSRA